MKISVCIGTRPELIKMAPVIRRLKEAGFLCEFIHSNQHYSKELDADIIRDLRLDNPDLNLGIGSLPHAAQTGRTMEALENHFLQSRPDFLLVHGDTNTTLGAAIAAKKMNIPIGHIEAGLRSYDNKMPEEINRILVDRISDIHFAPTSVAKENLLKEGFTEDSIEVCGNTVVDAIQEHVTFAKKSKILNQVNVKKNDYILATMHRPENVDSKKELAAVFSLLDYASSKVGKKVVAPLHPRTKKQIDALNVSVPTSVEIFDPVGYIDMLALISNAALVMTDSGGIQEEAYVLKRPLMTMRSSTERPETLTANFIIGTDTEKFDAGWSAFSTESVEWTDVFGKGDTSQTIVKRLRK